MVFLCGELIILKDIQNCVGGHILCTFYESDSTDECSLQSVEDDPCGFCGLDGCLTQLLEKKGGGIRCMIRYNMYKAAAKFSGSSPCTNVPIHCHICSTSVSETLEVQSSSPHK